MTGRASRRSNSIALDSHWALWLRQLLVLTQARANGEHYRYLGQLREGRLEIKHDHPHLQTVVNRLVVGLLTAALFVGSSHLCGQGFPPLLGGVSVPGALGCAVAVFLGAVLLRQIVKDT